MIRMRLGELMAQRGIKANRISVDTGISRSTLSGIVNNTNKMIQLETLDTLCLYLKTTPNEFLEFFPANVDTKMIVNNLKVDEWSENDGEHWRATCSNLDADLFVQFSGEISDTFELKVVLKEPAVYEGVETYSEKGPVNSPALFHLLLQDESPDKTGKGRFLHSIYDTVPISFYDQIRQQIKATIATALHDYIADSIGWSIDGSSAALFFEFADFFV